ncbi:MAG: radical SAM protein [Myxococcota bacterium]
MHFVIRFEPPVEDAKYNKYSHIIPAIPDVEIGEGDTVSFRGEETLTREEFYSIADTLAKRGVDFVIETTGISFINPDNLKYIFKRYRIKEIIIKIFSLNFTVNDDFFREIGTSIKSLMGLDALLRTGFKDISLITYIYEGNYLNRLKSIYDFKKDKGLKYLYIELDNTLSIERRNSVFKEILSRFGEQDDIIIRNNDFEIRLRDREREGIEIRTDRGNGILNLVLRNFCTNNCTFCTTRIVQMANRSPLPYDAKERVIRAIGEASKSLSEKNLLEIVAVEPLEHPDIVSILEKANECGFEDIRLLTHGRLIRSKKELNNLKRLGVREMILPIAFYSPESAMANVRDETAFYDMVNLLELIKNYRGIDFRFNIMLSQQNYRDIYRIIRFLKANNVSEFNINLALPSIEDERFYRPYAVKLSDLVEYIKENSGDEQLKEHIVKSLSSIIPVCIIRRYFPERFIMEIKDIYENITSTSLAARRPSAKAKLRVDCKEKMNCPYGSFCVGVNETYIKLFGDEEFYF